jgi:hypothetical protein
MAQKAAIHQAAVPRAITVECNGLGVMKHGCKPRLTIREAFTPGNNCSGARPGADGHSSTATTSSAMIPVS